MTRLMIKLYTFAVFSLTLCAIWPGPALAVAAPQFERLGQIRDGLRVPARIDVDAAGNLYVADSRLHKVLKFDRFGREVVHFDQVKASGSGLAVTVDGSRIYVAASDRVAVFAASGELIGYLGVGAGEFGSAGSIDVDSDGNVYVVDLKQRKIKVYTPEHAANGTLGVVTFEAGTDLAIDPNTDQIYLADSATVRVFDRLGNQLRDINAQAGTVENSMLFSGGMTFDRAGRFYIGDVSGKSVRAFAPSGTELLNYTEYSISRPASLAYDGLSGRLFVLRSDYQVDIYGVDGGSNPQQVNSAPTVPVAVTPIGGSEVASLVPELRFRNAIDADEVDAISYSVRLYSTGQQLLASFRLQEQPQQTAVSISAPLQEDTVYRWQVQASDGQLSSAWSDLHSFYVNADNQQPTASRLLAPLAGTRASHDSQLLWQGSIDADPFDHIQYLVEVAADATFTNPIISAPVAATELSLCDYAGMLESGTTYFWRVTSYDNHGSEQISSGDGRFLYQTTELHITANMPGARVYLGGHQNYAGQFVGQTPLTLRDLQSGHYQIVVERAGFESFLLLAEVSEDSISKIYAQLKPALQPVVLPAVDLVNRQELPDSTLLAPLVADLNLDGVEDLLLATAEGTLHFYSGAIAEAVHPAADNHSGRQVVFSAANLSGLPQLPGGTPCLIDWNNDYQQDLLIGAADGSVRLYLNQGGLGFATEGQWLAAVVGQAVPTVADIDQDGDKDLVVGSGSGELVLFKNIGTDAAPQLDAAHTLLTLIDAVAASFVDWDADGQPELLLVSEGQLYRAVYTGEGLLLSQLASGDVHIDRLTVLDLDGSGGKDLVVGSSGGQLKLIRSDGQKPVAAFFPALQAKLQQIEAELDAGQAVPLSLVAAMFTSLAERELDDLRGLSENLVYQLPGSGEATVLASELAAILQ